MRSGTVSPGEERGRRGHAVTIAALAACACLLAAAPASATTFCVPNTSIPACPAGAIGQANLEVAMSTNDNDGIADRVFIGATTLTDADTFTSGSGGDSLEVLGAGRGATVLTSSLVGGNNFVLNVQRDGVIRDLTVRIPASFADNLGAGLQVEEGLVRNVDIESRNVRSDGVSLASGADFEGGRLYGSSGGSIDTGFRTAGSGPASSEVRGATIEGAAWGVSGTSAALPVFVRRSRIVDAAAYAVHLGSGGIVNVYNTLIESSGGQALAATSFGSAGPGLFNARGVTMVKTGGPAAAAVNALVAPTATGSIFMQVHDSIIRGFESTYARQAPTDGSLGNAEITLRYSNFAPVGTSAGDGVVTLGPANIDADPLFTSATSYRLRPGSPSIDAADPTPTVALLDDFDGLSRPVDGNGDGVDRRDMGAFEFRPAPPATPVDPTPVKKKKRKKCKRKKKGKAKTAWAPEESAAESAKKKTRKKCKRKKKRKRR